MSLPIEIHSVFTEDGYWLGDFPNATLAEAFRQVVRQLDAELNEPAPEPNPEEPACDQYDADRLGV